MLSPSGGFTSCAVEESGLYKSILLEIRDRIRRGNLTISYHTRRAMYDDNLFAADIVHCILNGEILERQLDDVWDEYKYLIEGQSADEIDGQICEQAWLHVVAKLGRTMTP
jgi:hypothetical protein